MAFIVEMPKLSDTMEEGGIARWFKTEQDTIKEGEPLLEIETDKATMEYASPSSGVLLKILAGVNTTVALGCPIAILGNPGEDLSGVLPAPARPLSTSPLPANSDTITPVALPLLPLPLLPVPPTTRIKASPLAKKLAQNQGISLASLKGTGPTGRIIARDVVAPPPASSPSPLHPQGSTHVPLSMMRKTIAKRLVAAKNEAPHFYLTTSVHMEQVELWRQRLNLANPATDKPTKITINDVILFATAKALHKHPEVNSSWHEDGIWQHPYVHLCMAVSLPTGLITPVLRHADTLGLRALASTGKSLVQKARTGQLQPEDYQGGTFTVSNLGMTLVEEFTAIINPPQAAILAVGKMQRVPAVIPHPNGTDTLGIQTRMTITLSCDHRVIDGLVGAKFLATLVAYLEDPLEMLN